MKLKFILAGCFLLFSFNSFASETLNSNNTNTIEFFGFGSQPTENLCTVIDGDSTYIQIASVYEEVQASRQYMSYNCQQINLIGSSVEILNNVCEKIAQEESDDNWIVSRIDTDFLEVHELSLIKNIKSCD